MIWLIRVLLFIVLGLIGYGFFLNQEASASGEKFIGIGVLVLAFILMPVFIYHRYKGKKLEDFSFKKYNNKSN